MKFIDEAIIEVIAGDGGDGCASFRREKFAPKGGPDGGDGGRGGHVIFETDEGLTTLLDIHYRHRLKAGRGGHGRGKQMYGKNGDDCVVRIPVGTAVYDAETNDLLADLDSHPASWTAAKGGRGGRGNMHFVSATSQAPTRRERGEKGEHRTLRLELKLLADVGLIGLPNAGKSTLISAISNSRPRIADYPFTTTSPNLGVVKLAEDRNCVVADIPGLIEGASRGAGLGIQFLRHIERTRLLVHLIDLSDPSHPDPLQSYELIRAELLQYNPDLVDRAEIVCLTKLDLPDVRDRASRTAEALGRISSGEVVMISASQGVGLTELLNAMARGLWKIPRKGKSCELPQNQLR